MPINPLPLIGIARSVSGLISGGRRRRRNRRFARQGGEISSAQIDLNRERARKT